VRVNSPFSLEAISQFRQFAMVLPNG